MCRFLLTLLFVLPAYGESRKRIYVLDTGISPAYATAKYMCRGHNAMSLGDTAHGDNVTSIIGIKIDMTKYCVYPVNIFPNGQYSQKRVNLALYLTVQDSNAVAVNMSIAGPHKDKSEFQLLRSVSRRLKVIVAAGNDNLDLRPGDCKAYPACYGMVLKKNFYVVEASDMDKDNRPHFKHYSELGRERGVIETMSGTSQACAEFTGGLFR